MLNDKAKLMCINELLYTQKDDYSFRDHGKCVVSSFRVLKLDES